MSLPASHLDLLRRWAVLLDSQFRVPGTNIRFGLDAIIGLVPGVGDLTTPIFTVMVLLTGRMRPGGGSGPNGPERCDRHADRARAVSG
jgi:hypothetical protein